jgi:hypothetical protein
VGFGRPSSRRRIFRVLPQLPSEGVRHRLARATRRRSRAPRRSSKFSGRISSRVANGPLSTGLIRQRASSGASCSSSSRISSGLRASGVPSVSGSGKDVWRRISRVSCVGRLPCLLSFHALRGKRFFGYGRNWRHTRARGRP